MFTPSPSNPGHTLCSIQTYLYIGMNGVRNELVCPPKWYYVVIFIYFVNIITECEFWDESHKSV